MTQKAFIFDMDGVIIDSEPLHLKAKLEALQSFGLDVTAESLHYERYVGRSAKEFFQDIAAKFPECKASWLEMAEKKHEIYIDMLKNDDTIQPIAGIPELLARLKANDYKIGLGSSSIIPVVTMVLTRFGIIDYFQCITGGNEVPQTKPSPAIYLLAAERLGVEPANCTVIEDANAGVRAAKAAGMHCIAYLNPNSGKQDLSLADQLIKSYDEINL